jgi:hypothetical protein
MPLTKPPRLEHDPNGPLVGRLRPSAAFALFDGQPTVFCEAAQALYALNAASALIWHGLADGGVNAARAALVAAGRDARVAARHVDDAIAGWLRLGLLRLERPSDDAGEAIFSIDGVAYSLATPCERLSQAVAEALPAQGPGPDAEPAASFQVIEFGGSLHIFRDGEHVGCCESRALAPTLKSLVIDDILARDRADLLFHAACLSRGGRALLLSGAPGAGKTTLSLQLAARKFGFCGDDIVRIAPDGRVTGMPFPPTVKSGAWDLFPALEGAAIHHRADGQEVKYAALGCVDHESRPVGWVVFLRREAGAAPKFLPVDGVEALRRIIAGAHAPNRRLSLAGFATLRRILAEAATVEIVYSRAAEAADALCAFCDHGR